ncbi:hypothetical protein AB6A40_004995 [Gnathostoma spinigerum]|uniref:Uncharacterized protein n=1 Tax=Gnathostoma spinigerum TaxID=75299 RepID=A0ABD6EGF8_9BILA
MTGRFLRDLIVHPTDLFSVRSNSFLKPTTDFTREVLRQSQSKTVESSSAVLFKHGNVDCLCESFNASHMIRGVHLLAVLRFMDVWFCEIKYFPKAVQLQMSHGSLWEG